MAETSTVFGPEVFPWSFFRTQKKMGLYNIVNNLRNHYGIEKRKLYADSSSRIIINFDVQ